MYDFFKWNKCDLHFHTPASRTKKDYEYPNATPKDIVDKLILPENNLKLVAITDHNIFDKEQFLALQKEGKGHISFLPGVELKVDGYDVVLIIEPTEKNLEIFDEKILIFCQNDRSTGSNEVEQLVESFKNFNYILIPEYNRGNGGEKSGHNTKENDKFKLMLLCHFYNAIDIKNVSNHNKTTVDFIREMFKYANTHLNGSCIFVSDNHNIKYYPNKGSKHSNTFRGWTYINSEPTFYGLKFALSDSSRIFLTEDINGVPEYIEGRSEFLIKKVYIRKNSDNSEVEMKLSPYLNTIIGGRSSGKSYLIKKIVSKFDDSKEDEFQKEYKDFWKAYSVKLEFYDGKIINYNEQVKSEKIIYLEQNHVIKNIENNIAFEEWYKKLSIKSPQIDEKLIELKKSKIERNIRSFFLKLFESQQFISSLNYNFNLFNYSALLLNQSNQETQLYNIIDSNIKKFNQITSNNQSLEALKEELNGIKFDENFFISQEDQLKIKTYITGILGIIQKSHIIEIKFAKGLGLVTEKINSIKQNEDFYQKAFSEWSTLKTNYYSFGIKLNELFKLKKLIWNSEKKEYKESIDNLNFTQTYYNWKFITNIIIKTNDEIIRSTLSKIFKNSVYNSDGTLNPFCKLEKILLTSKNNSFKSGKNAGDLNNIEFYNLKNEDDILDDENNYYSKTSPGGKAHIILKMLLKKERLKNKIVVIDQPEDSLDNIVISKWLVDTIRDIKFSNQLLIVTHNANVVINGDAQNVVLPNRIDDTTINYLNSSFESLNTHDIKKETKTIFQNAISVLEGGKKELFKRTDKWNISILEGVNLYDIKSKMMPRKPNC